MMEPRFNGTIPPDTGARIVVRSFVIRSVVLRELNFYSEPSVVTTREYALREHFHSPRIQLNEDIGGVRSVANVRNSSRNCCGIDRKSFNARTTEAVKQILFYTGKMINPQVVHWIVHASRCRRSTVTLISLN